MKMSDRNDEEFVSLNQKHMNGHFHFFAARILTRIIVIFVSHPLPPRLTPNGIDLDGAPRPCESARFIRWPIGHCLCRSICRANGEFQRISMGFRLQHLQMPMNGIASNNRTINKNKEKLLKIAGRLMKTHTRQRQQQKNSVVNLRSRVCCSTLSVVDFFGPYCGRLNISL